MVTAEAYKQAERDLMRKEWKLGFRIHAAIYVVVISALVTLNVLLSIYTEAGFYWFPFPLVGWGIGLTMHYLHGVRWAERELSAREAEIEKHAEELRRAA